MIEALNKIDLLSEDNQEFVTNRARNGDQVAIPISASEGDGCEALLQAVDDLLTRDYLTTSIALSFEDGAAMAWLYERADVLNRNDDENGVHLDLRIAPDVAARFEQTFERVLG